MLSELAAFLGGSPGNQVSGCCVGRGEGQCATLDMATDKPPLASFQPHAAVCCRGLHLMQASLWHPPDLCGVLEKQGEMAPALPSSAVARLHLDDAKSTFTHTLIACTGRRTGRWQARFFILKVRPLPTPCPTVAHKRLIKTNDTWLSLLLQGSNLFWFAQPGAGRPRGHVPLEGACIHIVQPPATPYYMLEAEHYGV
jgi:hypothetical protein